MATPATTAHTFITDLSIGDGIQNLENSVLHFQLSLTGEPHVNCTIRLLEPPKATGRYRIAKKPSVCFSIDTGIQDCDEEQTLAYVVGNLDKQCSIRMADQNSSLGPQLESLVRKLTEEWTTSLAEKPERPQRRRLHKHSASSTSTLSNGPTPHLLVPQRPWMTINRSNASLVSASTASSRDFSIGDLSDEEEDIGLAFSEPLTPTTAATTPAQSPRKTADGSVFEGQMLAHLAAIESENMRQEVELEQAPRAAPTPPMRGLERPTVLETVNPRRSVDERSTLGSAESVSVIERPPTPQVQSSSRPLDADEMPISLWQRIQSIFSSEAKELPAVILPSPPTDEAKYIYGQTRRAPLYIFGTLSFLSVSVGMWFYTISAAQFYWFGGFCGLVQIYLIISYVVGYMGKDFDIDGHQQFLRDNPLAVKPTVDIYLPCCKEPLEVLENTYIYVSQMDYSNYKVHVLDDGGDPRVEALATNYGFNYITRDDKPHLKKAGNLRYAFARTEGAYFAIFDADFAPRKDFLTELLPYMETEKDIAIIQTPQFFVPKAEQTWVEQGASSTQELFYRIVQVNRDRWGAAICVGSNALYRRESLADVGGTAEIGHSEDVHTGFYALTRGWRLKYMPLALACGVSPDTPKAFFSQQMRWCSGSTTLLTNPDFWRSNLSVIQKMCFCSGFMYYSAAALMSLMTPLPGLLLLASRPSIILWFNCLYALPSLIYSVVVFRLWSRQRYNFNVNHVFCIQQCAYFMAIKDKICNSTADWVPSGDNRSHGEGAKVASENGVVKKPSAPNNKYRNARIMFSIWTIGTTLAVFALSAVRIAQGFAWYHFLPIMLFDSFNLFVAGKFIFCSS